MKLLRLLLSNLTNLFIAFALAVVIWATAVQVEDPMIRDSFSVPLQYTALPEDSFLRTTISNPQTVQIGFEGPSTVVNELTVDDFSAKVDLSGVPFNEEVQAPIVVLTQLENVQITFQSPTDIPVYLEEVISRDIPVVLDIRGDVARGHQQGDPLLNPPVIRVTGPASRLQSLEFTRATIFLNNDRETKVELRQPIFYDQQGNVASVNGLTLSEERVEVTIPVNEAAGSAEKFIDVDLIGQPAPGYRLLSINVDPPSVLVNGLPTQINALARIQTELIDITGLTDSERLQVALALPDGITLYEVEEIFVEIEIEPFLTTGTYTRVPEIQGLGEDLKATVTPAQVRVVLYGPLPALDTLSEEEIQVTVDLFDLEAGTFSVELDVAYPDRGIELRSVQPSLVTVQITRMVTATDNLTGTLPITGTLPVTGTTSLPLIPVPITTFPCGITGNLFSGLRFPYLKPQFQCTMDSSLVTLLHFPSDGFRVNTN